MVLLANLQEATTRVPPIHPNTKETLCCNACMLQPAHGPTTGHVEHSRTPSYARDMAAPGRNRLYSGVRPVREAREMGSFRPLLRNPPSKKEMVPKNDRVQRDLLWSLFSNHQIVKSASGDFS